MRCADCNYLSKSKDGVWLCKGKSSNSTCELRACSMAILKKHMRNIKGQVLEVGYGRLSLARRWINRNRSKKGTWIGLDPARNYEGAIKAYVGDIPFDDNSFDWVLAFSTIEHWHEMGDTVQKGLSEIHRTLKPGGCFLCTLPFHVHGDSDFVLGDVASVTSLFFAFSWDSIQFEQWRRDYHPLEPQYAYRHLRRFENRRGRFAREQFSLFKQVEREFVEPPSCWLMEVFAVKS